VAITSQGVTFLGAKCTREWPFAKLIRVKHFDDRPWTGIQVTTRERMSGFTYRGLRSVPHDAGCRSPALSTGQGGRGTARALGRSRTPRHNPA
jgi:hypothetical protein